MPEKCWAYILAFILGSFIATFWSRMRLASARPLASRKAKDVASRILPDGLFTLLTTGGTVALGRWGVSDAGPVLGVSWVLGVVAGYGWTLERCARNLVNSLCSSRPTKHAKALRAHARVSLPLSGFEVTASSLKELLSSLETAHGEAESKEKLRQSIAALKADLAAATGDLKGKQRDLDLANGRATAIQKSYEALIVLIGMANVIDYCGWSEREFSRLVQVLVNEIARTSDGSWNQHAVSIYLADFSTAQHPLQPVVYSCPAKPGSAKDQWICNDPVDPKRSLVALAAMAGRPILWPEQQAEFTEERFKPVLKKTANVQNWPTALAIPIPFRSDDTVEKFARKPYGVLLVRRRGSSPLPAAISNFAYAGAALADLWVQLSSEPGKAVADALSTANEQE